VSQRLRGGLRGLLDEVEGAGRGYALRWEKLDADFTMELPTDRPARALNPPLAPRMGRRALPFVLESS
jgi:hypothetical protein